MATTARGLAIINAIVGGTPTNIAAWADISVQTASVTQQWDEEMVKNSAGVTASIQARDARAEKKMNFKPTAQTLADAKGAAILLAPLATLSFTGSDASDFDGDWQLQNGAELSIKNDATADYSLSCRQWLDPAQNASLMTEPS